MSIFNEKIAKAHALSEVHPEGVIPEASTSIAVDQILTASELKHDRLQLSHLTAPDTHDSTPTDVNENVTPTASQTRSTLQLSLIIGALFLSLFVAALDVTIVATATPVIAHELNSATGYTWVGGAYIIARAVAGPIWAKLSDIWGRKVLILGAVAFFSVTSAICGAAQTMSMLIAGRALQGVAGGGIMLLVNIVISDLFSLRRRSLFQGLTHAVYATAGAIGPPLGGVFASLVSWRWCFYINLPICGVSFVLLMLFLDIKHEKTSFKVGLRAIDWLGILCFLAFTLMVLLGLDFGGDIFAWDSAKVLCLLVIGVCMLGAFVYNEAKLARYPLLPLGVFKDRSNIAAVAVATFHGMAFSPAEWFLPLYLQSVKGESPVKSGIVLVPFIVAISLSGVITGLLIHKTGHFRQFIWVGSVLLCLGNGLFIMLDADTPLVRIMGMSVIFGVGAGMLFQPPLVALQSRTKQADVATATSTMGFFRSMATSVSLIIGGVVFQNSMNSRSKELAAIGLSASVLQALSGQEAAANVAIAGTLSDPVQQAAVKDAFVFSLRNMWIMYTALAAMEIVSGLLVAKSKLSKDHVETVTGIKVEKAKVANGIEMKRIVGAESSF